MITAIEIENFKAFGKRQRIELKPITLLFGPNSAGKSTIIQVLHYAYEALVNRNLDVGRTTLGGDYIDLGGFRNLIYNQDVSQSIRLRFELDLEERDWPQFAEFFLRHEQKLEAVESKVRDTSTAWVELAIRWNDRENAPYVAEYSVGLDGQPLGTFKNFGVTAATIISDVNTKHPHFAEQTDEPAEVPTSVLDIVDWSKGKTEDSGVAVELPDALPNLDEVPQIAPDAARVEEEYGTADNPYSLPHSLLNIVGMAMTGPGRLLRDELADYFRYLGPLRLKPERGRRAPVRAANGDWASGIAAWDYLHTAPAASVAQISEWMAKEGRLETGYEVNVRRYRELDEASGLFLELTSDRPLADLDLPAIRSQLRQLRVRTEVYLTDTDTGLKVLPYDVGEGIAQVLPVVVAILAPGPSVVAVEQPELHVHPRIQVEIGELLIKWMHLWQELFGQMTDRKLSNSLIIETHSEHILLRLLRRVRETSEQTAPDRLSQLTTDQFTVIYVESGTEGAIARELRINAEGDFVDNWPDGFFDERGKELLG